MTGAIRFGNQSKLSLHHISPFKVFKDIVPVSYRLALAPSFLGLHYMFHIFMIKSYHRDGEYIIKWYF